MILSPQKFSIFTEHFIISSIIYSLIVCTLSVYCSSSLTLQKTLSDCIALTLFLACFMTIDNHLLQLDASSFFDAVINDDLSFFTKILVCFFSFVYFFVISDFLKDQKLTSYEYLLIILLAVLGLIFMCSGNDFLLVYLTIELSSLAFYILASYQKNSNYSVDGGMIYFIIWSLSSAFFLFGGSFLYGFSGVMNFFDYCCLLDRFYMMDAGFWLDFKLEAASWEDLKNYNYINESLSLLNLGFLFILLSLSIKLALAPFHLWSLDVYENSPISSSFFFAVISKLSFFVLVIRIYYICFLGVRKSWQFYFILLGIFSIFIGSFSGLRQRKLKTLLAYSSINHMGYMLLALSTATTEGIMSMLFYMVIYMISGFCFWSILLYLRQKQKNLALKYNKELGDLSLLKLSNKTISYTLLFIVFSMSGIPPLVGFLAKLLILLPLIKVSFYFAAFSIILASFISTFYYIRIVKVANFENGIVGKLYMPLQTKKLFILGYFMFLLIFFFFNPHSLHLMCFKSSFSLLF